MDGIEFPLASARVVTSPVKLAVPGAVTLNTTVARLTTPVVASHAPPNVTYPLVPVLAWNGPPGHCGPELTETTVSFVAS